MKRKSFIIILIIIFLLTTNTFANKSNQEFNKITFIKAELSINTFKLPVYFPINFKSNDSINFITSKYNDDELKVYNSNNELIYNDKLKDDNFFVPKLNGEYKYVFKKEFFNNLFTEYTFILDVLKKPSIHLNKEKFKQGEYIKVEFLNVDKNIIPEIKTNFYKNIEIYQNNNFYFSYIPISAKINPGNYKLFYKIDNNEFKKMDIEVLSGNFKTQYLTIKKSTLDQTSSNDAVLEYYRNYRNARNIKVDKKYYDEKFILPIKEKGRLTTEFGEERYINNRKTSYNHTGIDIANKKGTKVYATNNGKVVLSKYLKLTGNTIIINHGHNIYSYYQHLDSLNVKETDIITKDQLIGTIGSTGRSTGDHLHFGMSINNEYISPGNYIFNQKIRKENYENIFKNKKSTKN